MRCQSQNVLIEPGCCGDLGNVASWREAVGHRQPEWRPLWIGHPALSVLYRARDGSLAVHTTRRLLRHAGPVCPNQLQVAIDAAEIELERLVRQIAVALPSDYKGESRLLGGKLAGLGR